MTTFEARVEDEILTASENLVIARAELAMESVNASSRRDVDIVVPDPERRIFAANIKGLQMTASTRRISNSNLNKINETRCNFTVNGTDLSVSIRKFDRRTYTHHNNGLKSYMKAKKIKLLVGSPYFLLFCY